MQKICSNGTNCRFPAQKNQSTDLIIFLAYNAVRPGIISEKFSFITISPFPEIASFAK